MKKLTLLLKVLVTFSIMEIPQSLAQSALPEHCIQSPSRVKACPHTIFKRQVVNKSKHIVCVCLEDFNDIRFPAKTALEQAKQKLAIKQYAAEQGLSEAELLRLIR